MSEEANKVRSSPEHARAGMRSHDQVTQRHLIRSGQSQIERL